jgi:hypothetical protein
MLQEERKDKAMTEFRLKPFEDKMLGKMKEHIVEMIKKGGMGKQLEVSYIIILQESRLGRGLAGTVKTTETGRHWTPLKGKLYLLDYLSRRERTAENEKIPQKFRSLFITSEYYLLVRNNKSYFLVNTMSQGDSKFSKLRILKRRRCPIGFPRHLVETEKWL